MRTPSTHPASSPSPTLSHQASIRTGGCRSPLPLPHLLTPDHPLHNVPIELLLPHIFGPHPPPVPPHASSATRLSLSLPLSSPLSALSSIPHTSLPFAPSPLNPSLSAVLPLIGSVATPRGASMSPMLGSLYGVFQLLPSPFPTSSLLPHHQLTSPALSSTSSPPSVSLPAPFTGSPSLLPSLMASPSQPGLPEALSTPLIPSLVDSPPFPLRHRAMQSELLRLASQAEGEAGGEEDGEESERSEGEAPRKAMGKSIFIAGQ